MSFDPAGLQKMLQVIEAQYGSGSIHVGGNARPIPRISTGSLELDYAMAGGLPFGRFSRFWGAPSSGKSLVSWNIVRSAQAMGLSCAYYNAEKQYDEHYVKKLGVDVKKLIVVEGSIIEEIATKMETLLGAVNLHVIDSCSSCVSVEELNSDVDEWRPGLNARVWGKVFRRLLERFDPEHNAGLLIDQARATIGPGAEHPPGGKALEHASSMTVDFRKGAWLYRNAEGTLTPEDKAKNETLSTNKEPDGMEYVMRVSKSRVGRPGRSARAYYDIDKPGFDHTYEYARAGRFFGIIKQAGAWFTLPSGVRCQGEAKLRAALRDDPAMMQEILDHAMREATGAGKK